MMINHSKKKTLKSIKINRSDKICIFAGGPRFDILSTILNELEQKENLDAKDPADTNFFITAMGVCSDHLQVS